MTLFDADSYLSGEPKRTRTKRPSEKPPVVLGQRAWILLGRTTARPSAHMQKGAAANASVRTECGLVGYRLTHQPGQRAEGCLKCIEANEKRIS